MITIRVLGLKTYNKIVTAPEKQAGRHPLSSEEGGRGGRGLGGVGAPPTKGILTLVRLLHNTHLLGKISPIRSTEESLV